MRPTKEEREMDAGFRHRLLSVVILVCGMSEPILAAPADPVPTAPKIVVHLLNRAQIEETVLERTGEIAAGLFRAAGVQVVLQLENDRDDPSAQALPSTCHFYVYIMAPAAIKSFGLQQWAFALGMVLGNPEKGNLSSAYISDRIANRLILEENMTDRAPILGCAIAHELGHILLRQKNHSYSGIMQAKWDHRAIWKLVTGASGFILDEPARLKAEVVRRLHSQSQSG
jgi:hypothetical protein